MKNLLKLTLLATVGLMPLAAQAQDKTTINWALWDWDATAYYQPIIDAFEAKYPDIEVEHTDLGSADFPAMLMTQLSGGGSDLDVVLVKDTPSYANLVRTNLLTPLNDDIAENGIDTEAYGGLIEALTVDGNVYALPFRSDVWILYYNKDLFDEAGVEYPTNDMTWDEFAEKARAVTSGFGANKTYGGLFHTWRSTVQLPCIMDGEHTLDGGSYEFLAPCYERVLSLQEDGAVQSYAQLKTSGTHYSGPFYNGAVAMMPMGSWFIGTQIQKVESGESLATNWGIARYPHMEGIEAGTTAATVTSVGVAANSENKDAAMKFANFIAGPEGAKVIAETGTFPALMTDEVLATITSKDGFPTDETSKGALKTVKSYLEMPVNLKAADIEVVLNRAHDNIMTDNISVEDGLKNMDEGVQQELNK
ncbi:ABC transporter substrate-binding protein [Martelella mediterranea]|uniref:Carbohydrate ABC transporter substrate-binding protein (CUT1 family) n=1 Tax=Martelella mediterranea TaxID=293089 RepID=A0A4R3NME2_9HYPH|nr:sugar ABC transporter substrate-binding protein [Martelella mediterranea]TCT31747.1 carbohydrate ABC transporter substrate-binding protein (CUT1 family) [Martelella mediterranea]